MTDKEYDQKKQECWATFKKQSECEGGCLMADAFFHAFDRAYALGKHKGSITQDEIEKASQEHADNILYDYRIEEMLRDDLRVDMINLFKDAIDFALGKQEKDAEGEEMLTVSRKQVQSLYNYHKSRGHHLAGESLIKLFGSKCLPDNVDSSEPKPAEPKFKVGQLAMFKGRRKVEIIGYSDHAPKLYRVFVLTENYHITAHESDLEPYTEPEKGSRNLSKNIANCDKQFDNILKDSFREHNRLHIAAMVIASIMGSCDWSDYRGATDEDVWRNIAKASLGVADALLAECEKGGKS